MASVRTRQQQRQTEHAVPFVDDHRAATRAGEAELVWRCDGCGALGHIVSLPLACPDCGTARAGLYYVRDD